jgi:uncharacterized tellurite resistance protein B-like protein
MLRKRSFTNISSRKHSEVDAKRCPIVAFEGHFASPVMPLLRIPPPLDSAAPHVEPKPSTALKTIATRLPPSEIKAVEAAAENAGQTCADWMREAILLHLKRPARKKKSSPDPTLLAEILGLRSLVQNLIAAASDLPEETVQRIVKHADTIKQGKAEEILKRLEDLHSEAK